MDYVSTGNIYCIYCTFISLYNKVRIISDVNSIFKLWKCCGWKKSFIKLWEEDSPLMRSSLCAHHCITRTKPLDESYQKITNIHQMPHKIWDPTFPWLGQQPVQWAGLLSPHPNFMHHRSEETAMVPGPNCDMGPGGLTLGLWRDERSPIFHKRKTCNKNKKQRLDF